MVVHNAECSCINNLFAPPCQCLIPIRPYGIVPQVTYDKYQTWPKASFSPIPLPSNSSIHENVRAVHETACFDPFDTKPFLPSMFATPYPFNPEPDYQIKMLADAPSVYNIPFKELPMRPFLTDLFKGRKSNPITKNPSSTDVSDQELHSRDSSLTNDDENVFNRDPRILFPGVDDEGAFRPEEPLKYWSLHEQFGWSSLDPAFRVPCQPDDSNVSGPTDSPDSPDLPSDWDDHICIGPSPEQKLSLSMQKLDQQQTGDSSGSTSPCENLEGEGIEGEEDDIDLWQIQPSQPNVAPCGCWW